MELENPSGIKMLGENIIDILVNSMWSKPVCVGLSEMLSRWKRGAPKVPLAKRLRSGEGKKILNLGF